MVNPLHWLQFFLEWRAHPRQAAASLVVSIVFSGILIAASGADAWSLPFAKGKSTIAVPLCTIQSPADEEIVAGEFEVEGTCPTLAGKSIFVVLRDVYRYAEFADAPTRHWLQCEVITKDRGAFLCGAFGCIDEGTYEVLVVVPMSVRASGEFSQWFRDESNVGKVTLPRAGEIALAGENHTVKIDHSLGEPSPRCRY